MSNHLENKNVYESIKVSLIVPVYNVAPYLQKCIDSIINQNHQNLEIILVDDGSTDESSLIADDYSKKDARVKVIHKHNEGVSVARNVGIENATGEYICFCDADDIVQKDYVDYLLNMAIENSAEVAISTRLHYTFFDESFPDDPVDKVECISGREAALRILYYHMLIGCNNKIFKRSFLGSDVRFIPKVAVGEGFNFNVYAFCKASKVAVGKRRVYLYRRDNPNSCMTFFKLAKSKMAIEAINLIREKLLIKDEEMLKACDYAEWHTTADMYNWMVLANAKKDFPDVYRAYKNRVRAGAFKAIFAPVKKIEKIKAFIELVNPRFWALALEFRRWASKKKFNRT